MDSFPTVHLFLAKEDTRVPIELTPTCGELVHVTKEMSVPDTDLLTLSCLLVAAVRDGKPRFIVELIIDPENRDEDTDIEDDADYECENWIKNNKNSAATGNDLKELVQTTNQSYRDEIVKLGRGLELLVVIDARLDPDCVLRKEMLTHRGRETELSCNDKFPLRTFTKRENLEITDSLPVKPCFYPLQEYAAQLLIERMRFILHSNNPTIEEGKEFASFTEFDFRIYTARSKMLEAQTINRVCDKRSRCFNKEVYAGDLGVKAEAEKRVKMYVRKQENEKDLEDLQKTVKSSGNKFFLIIADEAHWGISKQCVGRESANNKMVNMWNDVEHPNVIVLLVTATPWNLLTENSRLPLTYVAADKRNANRLIEVKERRFQLVDTDGQQVTQHVGPRKELHVVKWSETLDHCLQKGLLVSLRVPQKRQEQPIWLCLSHSPTSICIGGSNIDIYVWEGYLNPPKVEKVLLKVIRDENQESKNVVTISTENELMVLVLLLFGGTLSLGFVSIDDFEKCKKADKFCDKFNVIADFNENIMEFQSCIEHNRMKQLMFDTTQRAGQEIAGRVKLARPPPDEKVEGCNLVCHGTDYTFLVETRSLKEEDTEQYLSLNFYYNTMRNKDRTSRLIRGDDQFQQMLNELTEPPDDYERDDILAAEYSFHILLVHLTRERCKKADKGIDFSDVLQRRTHVPEEFIEKKRNLRDDMVKELRCETYKVQPIKSSVFQRVSCWLAEQAWNKCRQWLEHLKKKQKLNESDVTTFVEHFCYYYFQECDVDKFSSHVSHIHEELGVKLEVVDKELLVLSESEVNQILLRSETFQIVDDLIIRESPASPQSQSGIQGHMKVVRVNRTEFGDRMYATLTLARKLSCKNRDIQFEVVRYFDKFKISDCNRDAKDTPVYRIWQLLQRKDCSFENPVTLERCICTGYSPEPGAITCSVCSHEHTMITQFSDMDRLPCIVILVEKGRMGDTFPPSFNVMDLRVRSQTNVPTMTSVMQELGRMCRYQAVEMSSKRLDYSQLPYALVGPTLYNMLDESLLKGATFYSAYQDRPVDRYCKRDRKNKPKTQVGLTAAADEMEPDDSECRNATNENTKRHGLVANSRHYDHGETAPHKNRLLFQAEPQIGKTGVFLKTISLIREMIEEKHQEEPELEDSDEGSDTDDCVGDVSISSGFPYWKDMKDAPGLKTTFENSKYTHIFGPYEYNHPPEYVELQHQKDRWRRQQLTKKTAKLQPKIDFIINGDQYRTYNQNDHLACVECKSSARVNANARLYYEDGNQVKSVRLSIPKLKRFRPLIIAVDGKRQELYHKRDSHRDSYRDSQMDSCVQSLESTCSESWSQDPSYVDSLSSGQCEVGQHSLKTWIFNPSYGRAEDASVNYYHTINSPANFHYVQILVVRPEEYDAYARNWQTTHAILELPSTLPDCEVDVNAGGIGFCRRFIQMIAEQYCLRQIFLIDDNIFKMYQMQTNPNGTPICDNQGNAKLETVPLLSVLQKLESQFECNTELNVVRYFEPYDQSLLCDCTEGKLHKYTGPVETYGALGVLKRRQNSAHVKKEFKKTHVFSLVLLNVSALKDRGIKYMPWQVHEDCNLNNDCDANSLIVCKYNRFIMTKRLLTPWLPDVYVWNDQTLLNNETKEEAKFAAEKILKWIRLVAAPKCLNVVQIQCTASESDGYQLLQHKNVFNGMVFDANYEALRIVISNLLNTRLGETHVVAFIDACGDRNGRDDKRYLEKISGYFSGTSGIGGFTEHLLIIPTAICLEARLVSVERCRNWCSTSLFEPKFHLSVLTSYNVHEFRVPFVVLFVKGKIKNAKDNLAVGNLGVQNEVATGPEVTTNKRSVDDDGGSNKPPFKKQNVDPVDDVISISSDHTSIDSLDEFDDDDEPRLRRTESTDTKPQKTTATKAKLEDERLIRSVSPYGHADSSDVPSLDASEADETQNEQNIESGDDSIILTVHGAIHMSDLVIYNTSDNSTRALQRNDTVRSNEELHLRLRLDGGSLSQNILGLVSQEFNIHDVDQLQY